MHSPTNLDGSSQITVVLITGASRGIGYHITQELYRSDKKAYHIILSSVNLEEARQALAQITAAEDPARAETTITPVQLDITSDSSIKQISQHFPAARLDVLVHNAGIGLDQSIVDQSYIREAFQRTFDTNVTGTHILTHALVPLLLQSDDPRLIFITSGTSSLHDARAVPLDDDDRNDTNSARAAAAAWNVPPPAGWPKSTNAGQPGGVAYRASKAALNMLMRDWARVLEHDRVKVWGVSPGFLATRLGGWTEEDMRRMGAGDPRIGGRVVRDVVEGKRDDAVGMVVKGNGTVQAW